MFTSALLELAKAAFASYITSFNPGSLYTGTLAAFVIIVFWVYYAAIIFILGGEVAHREIGRVPSQQPLRRVEHAPAGRISPGAGGRRIDVAAGHGYAYIKI